MQFFRAIQQRLRIGLQRARQGQQRFEPRAVLAAFDLLQVAHADPRLMRDLFLGRRRTERLASLADGFGEVPQEALFTRHASIVRCAAASSPRAYCRGINAASSADR